MIGTDNTAGYGALSNILNFRYSLLSNEGFIAARLRAIVNLAEGRNGSLKFES